MFIPKRDPVSAVSLPFLPPLYSPLSGSAFVRAATQLELHMGTTAETRQLTADPQRPRAPSWGCSVLPSAQQYGHCLA